jgi:PucR family transcriptional regulator, purine catabolism regulatory protein
MHGRPRLSVGRLLDAEDLALTAIAGETGLDREVRFAHTSELEAPEQWLDGGELLLTTGLGVPADPDDQQRYVRALCAKGAAGLAIGVRSPHLHQGTLDLADELGFPLLSVPRHIAFIAITRYVVEANYGASEHEFATQLAILEMLRVRAESTEPRWDLLRDLESLTGYDLAVVTPAGLSPESGDRLVDPSLLPVHPLAGHDYRLLHDGFVVPVRVGDRIAAFVVAKERTGSTPAGMWSIRHVATVAAVEMSSVYRDRALRRESGGRLLQQMLERRVPASTASAQMSRFGLDFDSRPVLCALPAGAGSLVETAHRLADEAIAHLVFKDEQIVCLLPNDETVLELVASAAGAAVGVSEPLHAPQQVAAAKRQAVWAMTHCSAQAQPVVVRFSAGMTFWLPHDLEMLEDVVARVLGPILQYDTQNGTDLLHSLDTYFKHDMQVTKAAASLYVHNHTLTYRLRRVEEITKRRLKSLPDQTELWLALQAHAITMSRPRARPDSAPEFLPG